MTRVMPCQALAYAVFLAATLGTADADVWDAGASTNDNSPLETHNELVHGLEQVHDLAARAGAPDEDYYVINQPSSSFEAIVDSTSADIDRFVAANFVRLAADGSTVVQESESTGGFLGVPGFSRALRWQQDWVASSFTSYLRVKASCGAACTSKDTYRIRFYDTTLLIPRFNNSGTQSTILVIQNPTGRLVSGWIDFLGEGLFFELPLEIPPYEVFVRNTASIPELQGHSGRAQIRHNAGYGELTGKAVSVEPATGFVFESPLVSRPH